MKMRQVFFELLIFKNLGDLGYLFSNFIFLT